MGQLVFVGLAVTVIALTLILANAGERSEGMAIAAYVLFLTVCVVGACVGVLTAVGGLGLGLGTNIGRALAGSIIGLLSGVLAGVMVVPAVRRWLAGRLSTFRAESPLHAVAAGLYILVLLQQVAAQVSVDQLKVLSQNLSQGGGAPSLGFIVGTNQLPMVILSFFGVGFLVRRNFRQALERLGLYWPGLKWILVSIGVALFLVGFGLVFDQLTVRLTPDQSKSIEQVSSQLLKNVSGLGSVIALGVAAGVGEEILFRGALQPRFGIAASAVLFAALHTQYAISLATLEILILGVVLGFLRRRAGTTGAVVAHSGYDIIVGLLTLVH